MDEFYYNAGNRIRELRERKGYTREKLAEYSNLSTKFLYEIETGQKGFSAKTLYKLSEALSVESDYIIHGTEIDVEKMKLVRLIFACNREQLTTLYQIFTILNDE